MSFLEKVDWNGKKMRLAIIMCMNTTYYLLESFWISLSYGSAVRVVSDIYERIGVLSSTRSGSRVCLNPSQSILLGANSTKMKCVLSDGVAGRKRRSPPDIDVRIIRYIIL